MDTLLQPSTTDPLSAPFTTASLTASTPQLAERRPRTGGRWSSKAFTVSFFLSERR